MAEVDRKAIAEAVWRYQMEQLALQVDHHWYLQLQRADPSPDLLDAFGEISVAPASEFEPGKGIKLAVDAIELTAEGATVEGHWISNSRGGAGYRYTLRRVGEGWEVAAAQMMWIA